MKRTDNNIIQVRANLQAQGIKLWLDPYYFEGIGSVGSEIDKLAKEFSNTLRISLSNCKLALTQLQTEALRKLAATREYEQTGSATFIVRRINNQEGIENVLEVKCSLSVLGEDLQGIIADKLELLDGNQVKCIYAGKILDPQKTLEAQGMKNNQQVMVIVSQLDNASSAKETFYDRVHKIKMDVEVIMDSNRQLFEMEDQDGNALFLPPEENRALLMAMSYCEKARVAMKKEHYDEALILLLESDEKFITCDSTFLETVDNYGLVNLDIVWCYLCLKNITQLPDAQRRLEICEASFRRSYGENMNRLIALKGDTCPERALIMRLHLLQGVVLFHQNRRDEALAKLELASSELEDLKLDEGAVESLKEMGYEPYEVRLGLRATGGNIERAINFIHEQREKVKKARLRSQKERNISMKLKHEKDWVNPRSVCRLVEMGFEGELVVAALKKSKNNLTRAVEMLQNEADELRKGLVPTKSVDDDLLEQLLELGFDETIARIALETARNNMEHTLDFLVKMFNSEDDLQQTLNRMTENSNAVSNGSSGASTSAGANSIRSKLIAKIRLEIESLKAYNRFNEDLNHNELDYLDLPLVEEQKVLTEYIALLEN